MLIKVLKEYKIKEKQIGYITGMFLVLPLLLLSFLLTILNINNNYSSNDKLC